MKNLMQLLLSISILSCLACEKKSGQDCRSDCIRISGVVSTEQNSAVPVDGAHLQLIWRHNNGFLIDGEKIVWDHVYSGKDGTYHINVPFMSSRDIKDGEFALHVKKANHLYLYPYTFTLNHADTSFNLDFHLARKAFIETNIKGFNSSDPTNSISVFPRYNSYMGGYPIGN